MAPRYEPSNGRCEFEFDFILRSSLGLIDQERSVTYHRSLIKDTEFYTATIKGKWKDPREEWPGPGELLSQTKSKGFIQFTTSPDAHETYFCIEKSVYEEEDENDPDESFMVADRTASAVIKVKPELMPFLIDTIRHSEQISLTIRVSATMEINKRIKEFVSGDQDMDIRYQITDFDIVS